MKLLTIVPLVLITLACTEDASERYEGPIIDMHLHAENEIWRKQQICFPQPCEGAPTKAASAEEVMQETLKAMDEHNIVYGFLSGLPEHLAKWNEAAPGRFLISPIIDKPDEIDLASLRSGYEVGSYQGMGEFTTQYWGYAPSDPELEPFFELAEAMDVPAHIHTLGIGAPLPTFRVSNGDPRLLEEVLNRHPKLRLAVENCGFPFTDEMIAMMYQYPQLYCEVSTIFHLTPKPVAHAHLEKLIEAELGKRIMFGSDQMIWPEVIGPTVEAVQSADYLSKDQKADLFYNNAARFLNLSDEDIARHKDIGAN